VYMSGIGKPGNWFENLGVEMSLVGGCQDQIAIRRFERCPKSINF
jgi:hypothetical protein